MRPAGETVVIMRVTEGGVDDYGYPIPGTTERIPVPGTVVDDGSASSYEMPGGVVLVTPMTVYFPHEVDIDRQATVEIRGLEYRLTDEPFHNRPAWPRAGVGGTMIHVERATT